MEFRLESIQQRRASARQANQEAARERKEKEAKQAEEEERRRERNKIAVRWVARSPTPSCTVATEHECLQLIPGAND